jgi:hypothetical protein
VPANKTRPAKLTIAAVKALRDRTLAVRGARSEAEMATMTVETLAAMRAEMAIITACYGWLRARRNTTSGNASRISDRDVAIITAALAQ